MSKCDMDRIWILILILANVSGVLAVYDVTNAGSIDTAITSSYKPAHRPSNTTTIMLSMGLMSLGSISIVDETINLMGYMDVQWEDPRLQWSSASYGGVTEIYLPTSSIWVPPLLLINTATSYRTLSDIDEYSSLPVKVLGSTGTCIWMVPAEFIASCSPNIAYFPFDKQSCTIMVSSWFYSALEVDVIPNNLSSSVDLDLYDENGEWDLTSSSTSETIKTLHGFPMPVVEYTLNLTRRYSWYMLNMVLPIIFLAILGSFIFVLPTESGEKVGFSLTNLLTMSVLMTTVSASIPPTATSLSIMSVYLLLVFIVCVVETIVTVVLLRVASLEDMGFSVSDRLQRFANAILAPVSRYKKPNEEEETNDEDMKRKAKSRPGTALQKVNLSRAGSPAAWKGDMEKEQSKVEKPLKQYTHKEIVVMFEMILFPVFFVITLLCTLICLLILMVGGSSS